jgi:T5SS/PEP-CTERM-associated repeat protein/predicted outer membrane repeat protein
MLALSCYPAIRGLLAIAAIALCLPAHAQTITYVRADAPPAGDGRTWATAYNNLQEAILATNNLGTIELWLARGTYTPDRATGNRTLAFTLRNNLTILGGFAGTESDRRDRNPAANASILSGDLARNDSDLGNPNRFADNSEVVVRASNVDATAVLDGVTIRDGYAAPGSINGLNGAGAQIRSASPTFIDCRFERNTATSRGGALYVLQSAPTLTRCTFADNRVNGPADNFAFGGAVLVEGTNPNGSAKFEECTFTGNRLVSPLTTFAGAACNIGGATPLYLRCTFEDNAANVGGAVMNDSQAAARYESCVFSRNNANQGAAAFLQQCPPAEFVNCTFYRNSSIGTGGAIRVDANGGLLAVNCGFFGNLAESIGGAIYNRGTPNMRIIGSVFSGNRVTRAGGGQGAALYCDSGGNASVINCTIANNIARQGAGIYVQGTASGPQTTVTVANSIIRGNRLDDLSGTSPEYLATTGGIITFSFSITDPLPPGPGNSNADPLFYDPNGPDLILGTPDDLLSLSAASPATDSGNPAALPADEADVDGDGSRAEPLPRDVRGRARTLDDDALPPAIVNIGAYEASVRRWNIGNGSLGTGTSWAGGFRLDGSQLAGVAPNTASGIFFSRDLIADYVVRVRTGGTSAVEYMTAERALVSFILNDSNFEVRNALPEIDSLDVSGGPGGSFPELRLSGASGASRTFSSLNAVLGSRPATTGSLRIRTVPALLSITDRLTIGRAGVGLLTLETGSVSAGSLIVGEQRGSRGSITLQGATSIDINGETTFGRAGESTLTITQGSSIRRNPGPGTVAFAELPFAVSTVLADGPGSRLDIDADRVILGKAGRSTQFTVTGGARLDTAAFDGLVIADSPGSVATVAIGTGSIWTHTADEFLRLEIGPEGAGHLRVDGTVTLPGDAVNHPRSSISGAGSISLGRLISFGAIRPGAGTGIPTVGSFTIQGAYEQSGATLGRTDSGSLELDLRGPATAEADRLLVTGPARLGGGLFVNLRDNFQPQLGAQWPVLSAASLADRFDVAVFPQLSPGLRFDLRYSNTAVTLAVSPDSGDTAVGPPLSYDLDGTPVASVAADFDGVNGVDLAVVCSFGPDFPGRLFILANSGMSGSTWLGFTVRPESIELGIDPRAIAAGRLDTNASTDLAVVHAGDDTLRIYANDGTGRFTSGPILGVALDPRSIAVSQIDGDGKADIAVSLSGSNSVSTFRNASTPGNTRFTPLQTIPVGREPEDIEPTTTNDKPADAIVANLADGTVSLLINTNGSLARTGPDLSVSRNPDHLRVVDLNRDNRPDIITANRDTGTISILRGLSRTTYAPPVEIAVASEILSIAPIDIDGDGDADLAVVARSTPQANPSVLILRNDLIEGANINDNRVGLSIAGSLDPTGANPALVLGAPVDSGARDDIITLNDTGPRASQAVSVRVSGATPCPPDFNNDGFLDFFDFNDFVDCFEGFACPPGRTADFNRDGFPDFFDFNDFVDAFDRGC